MTCNDCEHELDEHECVGEDSHGHEIWVCAVKGCRCEQVEMTT